MRNALLIVAAGVLALAAWFLLGRRPTVLDPLQPQHTPTARSSAAALDSALSPADASLESAAPATRSRTALEVDSTPTELSPLPASLARVVGRLVDPDGAPVVGARVEIVGAASVWPADVDVPFVDEHGHRRGRAVASAADGVFELVVPVPSGDVDLRIEPVDDHDLFRADFEDGGERGPLVAGTTDLGTLMLIVTGSIAGRVVDEAGAPLRDAFVRVKDGVVGGARRQAQVDERGAYTVAHVPPGTLEVQASCPGRLTVARSEVPVSARHTSGGIDFVLAPAPAIRGRVVDVHGIPQGVRILGGAVGGGQSATALTDRLGRFTLLLPQDEAYRIRVRTRDGQPLAIDPGERIVQPGTDDLEIVVQRMSPTVLVVVDAATAAPIERYQVATVRKNDPFPSELTLNGANHPDGRFELELDPEAVTLVVRADGYAAWGGPVVHEDALGTLTVHLARGGSLRGRVLARGEPVRTPRISVGGVQVKLDPTAPDIAADEDDGLARAISPDYRFDLAPHEAAWRSISGAANGTFVVDGLAPGSYGIVVSGADGAPLKKEPIRVEAGATVDLGDLELPLGGRVEGRVLVPAGATASGVGILLDDDFAQVTASDGRGRFTLEGLTPGEHRLGAVLAGSRVRQRTPVTVVEGETSEVTLDLTASLPCTVHVTVRVRGEPRAGIVARAHEPEGPQLVDNERHTTDAAGHIALDVVPSEAARIVVVSREGLFLGASAPIPCPSGGEASVALDLELGALTLVLPGGFELPERGHGSLMLDDRRERSFLEAMQERSHISLRLGPTGASAGHSDRVFGGTTWELGDVAPGRYDVKLLLSETHVVGTHRPDTTTYAGEVEVLAGERATCTLSTPR